MVQGYILGLLPKKMEAQGDLESLLTLQKVHICNSMFVSRNPERESRV